MKAVIIHGAYGNPDENWFPWLKQELERLGLEVYVPKFPTPDGQTLDNWLAIVREIPIDEETVLIGHSIGVAFILSLLEEMKVKASFLVSGFVDSLGKEEFDILNKSFVDKEFDWPTIKANCEKFVLLHSDNDPYVPLELASRVAEKLDVELQVVKEAGHFNSASGYETFELLLKEIVSSQP